MASVDARPFLATCFSDSTDVLDLHEMPIAVTGSWVKDGHRFSITAEDLDDIIQNFDNRKNGELVIDYEHASERPEVARGGAVPAAGWIKTLSKKPNEKGDGEVLWAGVEWVDEAKEMLEEKKYKYFSPAIDWGAVDKKTGRSKGATVTSGALTNHPFLEELPAIQLSEGTTFADGKQIVVPVVDNAKIKVKIDSKHDEDDDKKKLADISMDQKRSAIGDAIRAEYGGPMGSDICEPKGYLWVRDTFDDYAIVECGGKLYKITWSMDDKGNVTLGKPAQVNIEYVEASELGLSETEFSEVHGKVLADDGDDTKEGVHKNDYAYVGDASKKSTWKYKLDTPGRVQNALARWGQHKGIPKDKEPGALRKILRRAKKHGIKVDKSNPKYKVAASEAVKFGVQLSEGFISEGAMGMTDKEFRSAVVQLTDVIPDAKQTELSKKLREVLDEGEESPRVLRAISRATVKILDDIDAYGIEGDRGDQDKLRSEAESRAKKVDDPSDDDETEELRDALKKGKGKTGDGKDDDPDDELQATDAGKGTVARFSIRKMKASDGVGKLGHHAIIGNDGKLMGYLAHGDLMAHAKRNGAGMEGGMKASEVEAIIQEKTGRPLKLSDVTRLVDVGIAAEDNQHKIDASEKSQTAFKLMLSEAVDEKGNFVERKVRHLLAEERINQKDYAVFQDAVEDANAAINSGKFLPNQRRELVRLCLADRPAFEAFVKLQPRSERLSQVGASTNTEGLTDNPDIEVKLKIEELQKKDNKLTYSAAYSQVLASDKALKERYDRAHGKILV